MSYCLNPHCQKQQNPDSTKFCLACGSKLLLKDRYRALQLIGEGTFGRTFLAVDEDRLETRCAIKQFFPQVQEKAELEKATALFNKKLTGCTNSEHTRRFQVCWLLLNKPNVCILWKS